ncbi:MAG: DUF2807 domain-containing protein [Hyphomonadaceae bacterium]|nr:DUF2807 domain-containing protein [Hyphomonadaceae bacterium]
MKIAAVVVSISTILAVGVAAAEPRPLSGFTRVQASAGVRVDIAIGEAFAVDVAGRDADRIETRVSNGVLVIEPVRSWGFQWGRRDARVRVSMPRVEGLDVSSGAVISTRGVNADALSLEASSGASLTVAGACASFDADASSGAVIRAAELRCQNGAVDVSSGARADVFASNSVNVDASSGGDVTVHGGAGYGDVDLSSGGSLRRAD